MVHNNFVHPKPCSHQNSVQLEIDRLEVANEDCPQKMNSDDQIDNSVNAIKIQSKTVSLVSGGSVKEDQIRLKRNIDLKQVISLQQPSVKLIKLNNTSSVDSNQMVTADRNIHVSNGQNHTDGNVVEKYVQGDSPETVILVTKHNSNQLDASNTMAVRTQIINGNIYQNDTGRFPFRNPYDLSQRHPWYPSNRFIEVLKPARGDAKEAYEHYLNGMDEYRRTIKSMMYSKPLELSDITEMMGDVEKLRGHLGTFSSRFIKKGTFLGIYEGAMITSLAEWKARLEALTLENNNHEEIIQNMNLYSWSLKLDKGRTISHEYPMISAFSSGSDRFPSRCLLSNINTAIEMNDNGKPSYIQRLLNVKAIPIQTRRGKIYGLDTDAIAYVATKDIPIDKQMLVDYGSHFLNSIKLSAVVVPNKKKYDTAVHAVSASSDLLCNTSCTIPSYDYDAERDGWYPLRIFLPEDSSIRKLDCELVNALASKQSGSRKVNTSTVKPFIMYDDPLPDTPASIPRFVARSVSTRFAGTSINRLNKQAKQFIDMSDHQREKFFRALFKVEGGKVSTIRTINPGEFLGLYGGVIFKFRDGDDLAKSLDTTLAVLDAFAYNLYEHFPLSENYLITAQRTGNLLQMVHPNEEIGVETLKVNCFAQSIGLSVPDTMLFVSSKLIPSGTCLTSD